MSNANRSNLCFKAAILAMTVALACACGKTMSIDNTESDKNAALATNTAAATGNNLDKTDPDAAGKVEEEGACTPSDCPEADMDVASPAFTPAGLVGYVGQPVPWLFVGIDRKAPKRRVGILLNNIPKDSELRPVGRVAISSRIDWKPKQKMRNGKKLEIVMRDLERCELKEDDPKVCNKYEFLAKYDKKAELDWEILLKPLPAKDPGPPPKSEKKDPVCPTSTSTSSNGKRRQGAGTSGIFVGAGSVVCIGCKILGGSQQPTPPTPPGC